MGCSISQFGHIYCCKYGFQSKVNSRIANSVDPDETARHKQSHLGVHCLQRYCGNNINTFWLKKVFYLSFGNEVVKHASFLLLFSL